MVNTEAITTAAFAILGGGAAISAVAALKDRPPFRWLLSRLVVEPAEEILDRRIEHRVAVVMGPTIARVESIYKEVHPNSGSSLRDAVDATRGMAETAAEKAEVAADKADLVAERTARLEGAVGVLTSRSAPPGQG